MTTPNFFNSSDTLGQIAFGSNGDLYAVDSTHPQILVADASGNLLSSIGGINPFPEAMAIAQPATATVPLPGSLALLASGVATLAVGARRRRPAR